MKNTKNPSGLGQPPKTDTAVEPGRAKRSLRLSRKALAFKSRLRAFEQLRESLRLDPIKAHEWQVAVIDARR